MSAPTPLFPSAGPKTQKAYSPALIASAQARFEACLQKHEDGITTHKGSVKKNTHKCVTPTAAELAHFRHVLTTGTGAADANEKHRIKKDLRLNPADPSAVQWRNSAERGLKGAAADGHATIICRDYWGDRLLVAHINPETGSHLGRDATYARAEWPQGQPQAGQPEDTVPKVRPPMKEVVQAWIETCSCPRGSNKASTKRKRSADDDEATTATTTTAPRPKRSKKTAALPSQPPAPLQQPGADISQLPDYPADLLTRIQAANAPPAVNNNNDNNNNNNNDDDDDDDDNNVAAAPTPPTAPLTGAGTFTADTIDPRLLNEPQPPVVLLAAPATGLASPRLAWALAHGYYRVEDAVRDYKFPLELMTMEEVDTEVDRGLQQQQQAQQAQEQEEPQQAAEGENEEWKGWVDFN